jgi:hypothetical protein
MPARTGTAHVVTTRRIYKGKVYQSRLLRELDGRGLTTALQNASIRALVGQ